MLASRALSRLRPPLPPLRRASTDCSAAFSVDTVVVGAGVVGLAIGRRLAAGGDEVLVLDRAGAVASEASSRNSEVIHAGIYYPQDSVKSRTCVRGASLLRAFCLRRGITHRLLGKLVVATSDSELGQLAAIRALGSKAGAQLLALSAAEARSLEPELACRAALLSPLTGVLDTRAMAQALAADVEAWGGTIALRSRVTGLRLGEPGPSRECCARWETSSSQSGGRFDPFDWHAVHVESDARHSVVKCRRLVVAAGAWSQDLMRRPLAAASLPPPPDLYLAKGSYFAPSSRTAPFRRLVYPLPGEGGLGVHLTLDTAGHARFGPDVEWLPPGSRPEDVDWRVRPERAAALDAAVQRYFPAHVPGSLLPDFAGLRAKVQPVGGPPSDFVLHGPRELGTPAAALYGIESPGLTAALALAHEVAQLLGYPPMEDAACDGPQL